MSEGGIHMIYDFVINFIASLTAAAIMLLVNRQER